MKTPTETIFDSLIKETFSNTLKPLLFKKKGNNFYQQQGDRPGKIINIQKSLGSIKTQIKFTINTGIFSALYWSRYYNYQDKGVPDFPTEPECIIRQRIGSLLNQQDTWYEITDTTDSTELQRVQLYNLTEVIIPYLNAMQSEEDILQQLKTGKGAESPYARLRLLGLLNRKDEAKQEMEQLLAAARTESSRRFILETGKEYGLG